MLGTQILDSVGRICFCTWSSDRGWSLGSCRTCSHSTGAYTVESHSHLKRKIHKKSNPFFSHAAFSASLSLDIDMDFQACTFVQVWQHLPCSKRKTLLLRLNPFFFFLTCFFYDCTSHLTLSTMPQDLTRYAFWLSQCPLECCSAASLPFFTDMTPSPTLSTMSFHPDVTVMAD